MGLIESDILGAKDFFHKGLLIGIVMEVDPFHHVIPNLLNLQGHHCATDYLNTQGTQPHLQPCCITVNGQTEGHFWLRSTIFFAIDFLNQLSYLMNVKLCIVDHNDLLSIFVQDLVYFLFN